MHGEPLKAADWERIEALFPDLLDMAPDRREAFLDRECAGQPLLRAELLSLLGASERDSVLDQSPMLSTTAPTTLPGGTSGTPYSQVITPSGGVAPYTCAVSAGALPTGLTLADDGTLSGTTSAGSYTFTITCTDANGDFGSREYTLDVAAAPGVVWALVSDLPRMGRFSPENLGGRWLRGATGPAVGVEFLWEVGKAHHPGRWGQQRIDAPDFVADQAKYLGALGQVGECREGDTPLLGPP